jgi:hypothetical protein
LWDNAPRPVDQWIVNHGPSLRLAIIQESQGADARDRRVPTKVRDRVHEIRETRPQ